MFARQLPTDFASLSSFSFNQSNTSSNQQSNQSNQQIIGLPSNIQILNQSTSTPSIVNITQTRTSQTYTNPINYQSPQIIQPVQTQVNTQPFNPNISIPIQTSTVSTTTQTFYPTNQTQLLSQNQPQSILVFQNSQQQNQNQYQQQNQQQIN